MALLPKPSIRRSIKNIVSKNRSLKDILSPTAEALEVISVEALNHHVYNTKTIVVVSDNGVVEERVLLYNRLNITELLQNVTVTETTLSAVVDELNGKGFDFTEDDIDLVNGDIVAKPDSLGYYGQSAEEANPVIIFDNYDGLMSTETGLLTYTLDLPVIETSKVWSVDDETKLSINPVTGEFTGLLPGIVTVTLIINEFIVGTKTFEVRPYVSTVDETLRFKVMGGAGAAVSLSTGYGEWNFPDDVATNLTVNWGNGVTTNITSEGYDIYTYPAAIPPEGYIVEVTGTTSKGLTLSGDALVEVISYGDLGIRGISHTNATNLVKVPTSIPRSLTHLSVDNYTSVFAGCTKFNDPSVLQWDTSNIINMDWAFHRANAFNQPIGVWDTSNVISTIGMFYENTIFNQPLNNWDMSKVTSTFRMFASATAFNQPLDQWNVGQVTGMYEMFTGASAFNQDLSAWDVSNVTDMSYMFSNCSAFDGNITTWNTSKVTNMQQMFSGASVFNQAIGGWDVSSVTDMTNMFGSASAFNQPLSTWSTISLVNAASLFANTLAFNQDISGWDVSNVTDMSYMFYGATAFNQPLDAWNTSKVTDMSGMFYGASVFNQPIGSWNTEKVSNMTHLFRDATVFNQPINQWCVPLITDMPLYFSWNGVLEAGNIPVWGTCPRGENLV